MGNPMMTDKALINVTEWFLEYVRKYLEKHMKSSHFKEDAINKLLGQDVNGYPYELKSGLAERIIELVKRLKEKQEIPFVSVKVITVTEFEKFCENNKRQLEKLNKMMNTVITDINHLSFDINTTKEDIK
ncbi:10392_t:CDS:2 [Funneliformis mosseae]|uniref:10392_t:CDS:1 n=1 Tax=Funneliformis mosseae TaxID=27381 RepID=A0A9N9D151_FUNMO|nr:10392_t:CDS:2 [Funneliformis mosseae]